jgi:hydroxyacylglutathione hydrolase
VRQPASANAAREPLKADEGVLIDLRGPADFAQGHPRGAVSLPFSTRGLAQRLAVVLEPGSPIRLLAADPAVGSAALAQLEVAYHVIGVIDGMARRQAVLSEESLPDISVENLAEAASSGDLTVLDVREPVEWETGYVPGAVLISLGRLQERFEALSRHSLVAVICEAGVRSCTGASLLQAAGFPNVATVSEGMSRYRRAGLPLQVSESQEQS